MKGLFATTIGESNGLRTGPTYDIRPLPASRWRQCFMGFSVTMAIGLIAMWTMTPALAEGTGSTKNSAETAPLLHSGHSGSRTGITDFSKPFNEYTWLTAHNAYLDDVSTLLERGVRGLMLDIRLPTDIPPDQPDLIYLCHSTGETCDEAGPGKRDRLFSAVMNDSVMPFLKANPNEVVTIFLEDYVTSDAEGNYFQGSFRNIPDIENYIFLKSEFPDHKDWPTLKEIIDSGKRLIFISQSSPENLNIRGKSIRFLKATEVETQNQYDLGADWANHSWHCTTLWTPIDEEVDRPGQDYKPAVPAKDAQPCDHKYMPPGCPLPATDYQPEQEYVPPYKEWVKDPGIPLKPSTIAGGTWQRLFVMNQIHKWMKSSADAGNIDNNLTYLDRRVEQYCKEEAGTRYVPNYIALDYTEVGGATPYSQALTNGGFYFHEGPNADPAEDVVCVLPVGADYDESLASRGCENDEAQSMVLRGVPKGTRITVFDNHDANRQDDYAVINVKQDIGLNEKVVIGSFEQTNNSDPKYNIYYLDNNGLNGKISRIKIEQHPKDFADTAITLHEGYNSSENIVCTVSLTSGKTFDFRDGEGKDCDNDEAKSATINSAKAGTVITLYGNWGSSSCDQGCQRIEVKRNIVWPHQIGGFNDSWENEDVKVTNTPHPTDDEMLSGHVSSIRVEFLPDAVPPGKPGAPILTHTTSNSALLSWAPATDNIAVTGYKVTVNNGQPTTVSDTQQTISGLVVGTSYVVAIRAVDADGNQSEPMTLTFTGQDTTPPSQPGFVNSSYTQEALTLSWQLATDNVGVVGYTVSIDGRTPVPPTGNTLVVRELPYGEHTVEVRALDAAGNLSLPRTVTISPDTTPPSQPGIATVVSDTEESLSLNWRVSTDNVGVVGYTVSIDGNTPTPLTDNNIVIKDFPHGDHTVEVRAKDAAGNLSSPSTVTIKKKDNREKIPPSRPGSTYLINKPTPTSALFTWAESTDNVGVTGYRVTVNNDAPIITPVNSVTLNGLPLNVRFDVRVQALDAAENVSEATLASFSFGTDTQPPTSPGELTVTGAAGGHASAIWSPATDNDTVGAYGIWNNGKLVFVVPGIQHLFAFTALDRSKDNIIEVSAIDLSGNASQRIQRVLPAVKIVPPTGLRVLQGDTTSTKVAWDLNPEATYKLKLDQEPAFALTENIHEFRDLKPGTSYTYTVMAVFGTAESQAVSATFTTPDDNAARKPKNFRVISQNGTTAILGWDAPEPGDYTLTGYLLVSPVTNQKYGPLINRHIAIVPKGVKRTFLLSANFADGIETDLDLVTVEVTGQ